MAADGKPILFCGFVYSLFTACQAQEFCRSMNYWCKEGHCCGRGKCCTYYYELWWFWFVWLAIAVAGICCFYQKKVKHTPLTRRFFRTQVVEEQVTNSEAATNTENTPSRQPVDPDKVFHLPSYEELRDLSKDPPSYNQIFGLSTDLPQTEIVPPITTPACGPPAYCPPASSQSEESSVSHDSPPQYSSHPIGGQLGYCAALPNAESPLPINSADVCACDESAEAGLLNNEEPVAMTTPSADPCLY